MLLFLETTLSFPTVVFTMLLAIAVLYWLLAATGLVEIDALDGLLGADMADGGGEPAGITGPLLRYGLDGIPITLIFTTLVFVAWLLSYFADLMLIRHLPFAPVRWGAGIAVMVGALLVAVPVTGIALRPLRRVFAKLKPAPMRSFIGMPGVVRSPDVTATHGTATVEDGGAGLVMQVRDDVPGRFKRGDRVVLIEYVADTNIYRIVGDDEFRGT